MAKRLPKPYQRPQVALATTVSREWRHVWPWELTPGDTLGGFGAVGEVKDLGAGYVRVINSVTGQQEAFPADRPVYAFVKATEPAQADS